MKPKLLLRTAAGCLLFFATGHTIGHFTRHNVTDPKAKQVLQMMADNKFDLFGQLRSYDENYTGMSLNLTITLIALAIILLIVAPNAETNSRLSAALLLPILLCVAGFAVTSYVYFFMIPAVTCAIATLLIALAWMKMRRS